jgi:transposase-like protein
MSEIDDTAPDGRPVGARMPAPEAEVVAKASRRTFPVAYKLGIVEEYDRADAMGRGALLRREGLYTSHISAWRRARDRGAAAAMSVPRGPRPDPAGGRLAELEAANAKLAGELDTARSVIRIQGELAALLEQLSTGSAAPKPESVAGR